MVELDSTATAVVTAGVALACVAAHLLLRYFSTDRPKDGARALPPSAPGRIPVLGHALAYRSRAATFLTEQHFRFGAFSLNLAGFQTVVVSDPEAVRQVVNAPESILSEREAVGDFGFMEALGELCVYVAVGAHKRILRGVLHPLSTDLRRPLVECAQRAVAAVMPLPAATVDAIPTFRRIMLHFTIDFAVSPSLLKLYPTFMDEYIHFQDRLEDAIAATAVLPKAVARALKLTPVRKLREALTAKLATAIERVWAAVDGDEGSEETEAGWVDLSHESKEGSAMEGQRAGVWLSELRNADLSGLPGWEEYAQRCDAGDGAVTPFVAAQIIISLLFAAHKNPAIGAAQTLLLLLEHPTHLHTVETELDGLALDSAKLAKFEGAGEVLSEGARDARDAALTDVLSAPGTLEDSLPHLANSISEACRLTAHTLGAIRKVMAPDGFQLSTSSHDKYWVPSGTYIAVSHLAVSMDSRVFAQATGFHPCRYNDDGGDSGGRGLIPHCKYTEYEYTAFSQGLHRCPGQLLAMSMMKVVLAVMLDKFKVEKATDHFPDIDFTRATLGQRAGPCMLNCTLRRR